jgi:hypothetical protein
MESLPSFLKDRSPHCCLAVLTPLQPGAAVADRFFSNDMPAYIEEGAPPASCRRLLAPRPPCLPLPTASSAPPSNSSKSCPITSRYSLTCIPRSCGDASGACRSCTRRERIGEEAMHLRCGGGLGTTRSTTVRSAPCSCSSMPTWSPATTPTSSSVEIVATCECDWASEGDE